MLVKRCKPVVCGRCGRDFAKLVERIADQRRFEDEQRAARAAKKAYDEGVAGGDSAAEAGNRKPKGLVWEVSARSAMRGALRQAQCVNRFATAPSVLDRPPAIYEIDSFEMLLRANASEFLILTAPETQEPV